MLAVLAVLLSGCKLAVQVDTTVAEDGSGTVAVAIGLDEAALARFGDLDLGVALDDLRATGWTVTPAVREADGLTWLRASKPFATVEQGGAVLAELTGPQGALREFQVQRSEGVGRTSWSVTGTIDLSKGTTILSEPDLTKAFDGVDPMAAQVQEIERAEGKKAAEMVDVSFTVHLPEGVAKAYAPKLGDPAPTKVDASADRSFPLPIPLPGGSGGNLGWIVLGLVVVGIVTGLMFLRRRYEVVGR